MGHCRRRSPYASHRAGLRGRVIERWAEVACLVRELRAERLLSIKRPGASLFPTPLPLAKKAGSFAPRCPFKGAVPQFEVASRSSSPGHASLGTPRVVSAARPNEKRDGSRSRVPDTEAFPESRTGRDATSRDAPAGLPAGVGRGCSVGRLAPSSTRLPPSGRLTTRKVRLTYGKHSGSPRVTTPTPFRQALHEPAARLSSSGVFLIIRRKGREPSRHDPTPRGCNPLNLRSPPARPLPCPLPRKGNFLCHQLSRRGVEAAPPAGHAASASTPRARGARLHARRASSSFSPCPMDLPQEMS